MTASRGALLVFASCAIVGCSSADGGAGEAGNTVPLVVNAGPAGAANGYVNGLFASATICVPGNSSLCQTIDGLLVDTGSTGLRVLSSILQLPLARSSDPGGNTLANCVQFEDGSYFFGAVARADVRMGTELGANVPIQLISAPSASDFPAPPTACSNGGGMNDGTLDALGANGILGIGFFQQDCGDACVDDSSPGVYFACTTSDCSPAAVSLDDQVANPVSAFSIDDNGVVIALPAVAADGTPSVTGTLTFGVATQNNNALGSAAILWPDSSGEMTTLFQGQSYGQSSIDSGSNAWYFLDAATSGLPTCRTNTDFYCPAPMVDLAASVVGVDGTARALSFPIGNGDKLLAKDDYALGELAGPNAPNVGFLLGIPFFYGRTVFTVIENRGTPAGTGPFWAY